MQLLGSCGFPHSLDACAHCPAQDIAPAHALCDCPATGARFLQATQTCSLPSRSQHSGLLHTLFTWDACSDWDDKLQHILYVYSALKICAGLEDSDIEHGGADEPMTERLDGFDVEELLAEYGFQP